ncbi:MAG: exonuclease subunit SbcD [Myxococcota bacterium]
MRILHTSDWHLGRTLHGYSRADEHEAFLQEVVELCADVDLVILSGDVFETANPPIEAEELFFDTLARLGDGGRRAVVVIAGNHDSPDRLAAAQPLSARHGVWVFGRPGDELEPLAVPAKDAARVAMDPLGPSAIALRWPDGRRANIAALPYPSEARLRRLLAAPTGDHDRQRAYSRWVGQAFAKLEQDFDPGAVNLATAHLAVRSCMPRPSERVLVGGAYQIDAGDLPRKAHYTALGHLHFPQLVEDAPGLARYAGAPLAMRFSERDDPRVHTIVEAHPGQPASVELLPVSAGRPLVLWEAASLSEVQRSVQNGRYENAFIDLIVDVSRHLTHAQLASLKRLPRDFVRITPRLPQATATESADPIERRDLPVDVLFREFYRQQTGAEPDQGLVELFLELADGPEAEERPSPAKKRAG